MATGSSSRGQRRTASPVSTARAAQWMASVGRRRTVRLCPRDGGFLRREFSGGAAACDRVLHPMKRRALLLLAALVLPAAAAEHAPLVVEARIDTPIHPASASYLAKRSEERR